MEGCLDIAANNFDLEADRACDGCCTYPTVALLLSQKWNDANFSPDSIYLDKGMMPFRIKDVRYILSSFAWLDDEGFSHTIDSSEIECNDDLVRYTRDQVIVEPRRFLYILDTFRLSPAVKELEFKLGWKPELQCVDATDPDVPLVFSNAIILWDSVANTRAAIRLVLQRDVSLEAFDTILIHTCREILLDYDFDFEIAENTELEVSVNYAEWFSDAMVGDLNSFTSSILTNIDSSFVRTP